jgi:hypothetical protein
MSVLTAKLGGREALDRYDALADFSEEVGVCGEGFEGMLIVVEGFAGYEE